MERAIIGFIAFFVSTWFGTSPNRSRTGSPENRHVGPCLTCPFESINTIPFLQPLSPEAVPVLAGSYRTGSLLSGNFSSHCQFFIPFLVQEFIPSTNECIFMVCYQNYSLIACSFRARVSNMDDDLRDRPGVVSRFFHCIEIVSFYPFLDCFLILFHCFFFVTMHLDQIVPPLRRLQVRVPHQKSLPISLPK